MTETTKIPDIYKRLIGLIPKGDDNPISISELASILKTDIRYINSLVYNLVVKYGVPVCSYRSKPNNGVFIPVTDEQRARGLATQKEQVKSQIKKLKAIESADLNRVTKIEAEYPEIKDTRFVIPYIQTKLDLKPKTKN